jgi:transcriptional regulator with XRE-family HTH domain
MVNGLGKFIVARRKELGFSQQDLARMIGVPAANLSQLEHSPSRWRSRLIPALADALGVSQLELVMAARVIGDLPPFPSPDVAKEVLDPFLLTLEVNGHASPERAKERLRALAGDLTPAEAEFLLAVAETFLTRRQQQAAAADHLMSANYSETVEAASD